MGKQRFNNTDFRKKHQGRKINMTKQIGKRKIKTNFNVCILECIIQGKLVPFVSSLDLQYQKEMQTEEYFQRSSQTDSSTSESDNSSLLVDRILNANKRFRDQDIDDTANDADINLSCEVNIIANANDINAQTEIIEESLNAQAAVESNESDDIIIESYIGPSSKGPGKGVKMSAEFYKYAKN